MNVSFACQPSNTLAYCFLDYGESIDVEHGAMAMMSDGISATMSVSGGIGAAVRRATMASGELLTVRYQSTAHGAWVAVAPRYPGDMALVEVNAGVFIERGAAIAWSSDTKLDVKYAGMRSVVLREGAVLLHFSGGGKTLVGAYGGIQDFELHDGQEMVVDSQHLIAWEDTIQLRVGMLGSAATAAMSGEGLVAKIKGPGRVWCQTRSTDALAEWLGAAMPETVTGRKK